MAGEATRLCSQAAASCRRSHKRRRNTAVEAAGAGYVGKNFTLVTMQNVFSVNWSFVALGVVFFEKGGEDLGTGRASFEMWNCVGTSELVIDFGVAASKMSSLPLLCENLLRTPILASSEFTYIRILCLEEMERNLGSAELLMPGPEFCIHLL